MTVPPTGDSDRDCASCAERHPHDGCADVGCDHNCQAEVTARRPATGDTLTDTELASLHAVHAVPVNPAHYGCPMCREYAAAVERILRNRLAGGADD